MELSVEIERCQPGVYQEFKGRVLSHAKGKCLEIGCGDGVWSRILKEHVQELVALDLSCRRIEIARKDNPEVKFILSDARELPFKDKSFETIYALEVIEHLPSYAEQVRFLQEISRVLEEDGVCLISTPNKPWFRLYSWILRERHPTHFSELNYFQFRKLLKEVFPQVEIEGKFGWLSPWYRFSLVRKLHNLLSRFKFLCKSLLAICRKR